MRIYQSLGDKVNPFVGPGPSAKVKLMPNDSHTKCQLLRNTNEHFKKIEKKFFFKFAVRKTNIENEQDFFF